MPAVASYLVKDTASLAEVDLLDLESACTSLTVALTDGSGASLLAATAASVSTLTSTLSAPAKRGTRHLFVADVGDLAPGHRFSVKATGQWRQNLTCREVTSGSVYTYEKLLADQPQGAAVFGRRGYYTVAGAVLTDFFWHGSLVWTPTTSGGAQHAIEEAAHCVLHRWPTTLAVQADLEEAAGVSLLSFCEDVDDLPLQLLRARERLQSDLSGQYNPAMRLGIRDLVSAHALAWLASREKLEDTSLNWGRVRRRYEDAKKRLVGGAVYDIGQDRGISGLEVKPHARRAVRG